MFTHKFAIKPFAFPLLVGMAALVMVSCGTQNSAYNQNDGIYASGVNNSPVENRTTESDGSSKSNYYQQYFQSKSISYENAQQEEDVIFTDIDAYTTSERLDEEGNIIIEETNYQNEAYGPWGSNSESVSVNIYNYGNYGHGYGYGFYNPYVYAWNYPFYGYYGPSWRISFGWGWGSPYYGYYGYPGYYGYGHGYGYGYGYGYPYNYYNSQHVSYNRGRRNMDYNRTQARGRATNASTRSSYSRSENARRINRNNVRANTRTNQNVRNNSTIRNTRSDRNVIQNSRSIQNQRTIRNNSNIRNNSSNIRRNTNSRSSINTRSNTNTRSYSPPTRSSNSGSIRSSGGSIRSSGGSRSSGGRSSGGRGRG